MNLDKFLATAAETVRRQGPNDRIVMSSRVRLARNIRDGAFPGWAKKPERVRVLEIIRPAVESLPEMQGAFSETMDNLTALDKQVLVERHLVSREHAAKSAGSGLVVNTDETLAVMINEEDHLRMQALRPGLQIRQAWQALDRLDSELERKLEYAFSNELVT
jgi:protein arginine kinase